MWISKNDFFSLENKIERLEGENTKLFFIYNELLQKHNRLMKHLGLIETTIPTKPKEIKILSGKEAKEYEKQENFQKEKDTFLEKMRSPEQMGQSSCYTGQHYSQTFWPF